VESVFEIIAEPKDALERHLNRMESVNTNEKEDKEKTTRPKPRT
jgi:hypothetical protein